MGLENETRPVVAKYKLTTIGETKSELYLLCYEENVVEDLKLRKVINKEYGPGNWLLEKIDD